ncbi:MAG: GGDEF domain-containing protein [Chloroflexi bacterium]|nr:GGDEF domain-containing protein [Chloroflexota bacterium]
MQPPPPIGNEFLALPTITLMITITFIMQASAIAFNSVMVKEYKGVRMALLATISLALGFVILVIRTFLTDSLVGLLTNLFMITGYTLIYIAICRFIGKPLNRYLIYGLVPVGLVSLFIMHILPRPLFPTIIITQIVGFPLNFASALALLRSDQKRFRLGSYLTALPLMIYGVVTIIRIVTGIISPREVSPGPTLSNIFDVLSLYVLSYLWIAGFILMISQRLQSDLNDLAMNDALTRVRNRRAMQGMLDFEMRRVQTEVKDFSIILLDVDHFKRVNDTHGHDVGDLVLQWMAQTLHSLLRVQDVVARWGGEEFLILLPDTSLEEAVQTADRLRSKIEKTAVESSPVLLQITFSAGVANSRPNRNVDQICKVADQALYIAKQRRNRVISQDGIPTAE